MAVIPFSTLSPKQKQLIKTSFDQVLVEANGFTDLFYTRLLQNNPAIRALFKGDLSTQAKKLLHMLWSLVYSLEHPEKLEKLLIHYGKLHKTYGVKVDYFEPFKATLLWALEQQIQVNQKQSFGSEAKKAWSLFYDEIIYFMRQGLEAPTLAPDSAQKNT